MNFPFEPYVGINSKAGIYCIGVKQKEAFGELKGKIMIACIGSDKDKEQAKLEAIKNLKQFIEKIKQL